ncbi:Uma2 family endonuclease [Anatilimnocola sp. NA78]|uniref:Uma2 family endonuclease n=1 Tax=Anatilimnocola sp. NA78 TaxID=3415683 RepID=UPI003CE52254
MSTAELTTPHTPDWSLPPVETLAQLVYQLGDVPLERILSQPPLGTATADDLLRYIDKTSLGCELVDGTLVMKAMGYTESVLASLLIQWINNYLDSNPLGACAGEQGYCEFLPKLILAPDVSFMTRERLALAKGDLTFAPGAPDLCIEVLSKSNTRREISRKIKEYFQHGCRLVWVFDIRKQIAEVYLQPTDPILAKPADTIEGRDVLPGFQFVLGDLFAALEKRVAGLAPTGSGNDKSTGSASQS